MYLSAHQSSTLARVMATLAEPHDERAIRERLGALMLDLVGAQYYASYVWDPSTATFGSGIQLNMDPANLQGYVDYYQFHDPITRKMQQHRRAVRATEVLPHASLRRTEFFNDLLARDGLFWGVNVYAWHGGENIGDMRIWRDRRRGDFSRDEIELLDLVRPAFTAALQRCRAKDVPDARVIVDPPTRLSAREHEIAVLVAQGLADKAIAATLGISITTVRTHLDNAFRKLEVDGRLRLVRRLGL